MKFRKMDEGGERGRECCSMLHLYLGIVEDLEMFALPEAEVLVGAGIVVVEGHENLCVGIRWLLLGRRNGRWIDIGQIWVWWIVVWWVDGNDDVTVARIGWVRLSETLAHVHFTF